jgi:hypothetical protein
MSSISFQSVTTGGIIIDNARWQTNLSNFQVGDQIEIMIPVMTSKNKDRIVINFLKKSDKFGYSIDQISKDKFSITLSFSIKQIRHLIDVVLNQTETLCIIVPINKLIEDIILYMYDEPKCDQKFIRYISEF